MHQWKNGDRYEGAWVNCLKHGKGSDLFANQDVYTGTYAFGKPDGSGVYKWKSGSIYSGDFSQGMKHGRGEWRKKGNTSKCNRFDGNYANDKKNGQGVFTWESGNIYKGSYVEDQRQGYGEMYWMDGSVYKGDWVNGIQHGKGIMTFPDGRIKDGAYENNVFQGKTTIREGSPAERIKIEEAKSNNSQNGDLQSNNGGHTIQSQHVSHLNRSLDRDLIIKTRGSGSHRRKSK